MHIKLALINEKIKIIHCNKERENYNIIKVIKLLELFICGRG